MESFVDCVALGVVENVVGTGLVATVVVPSLEISVVLVPPTLKPIELEP